MIFNSAYSAGNEQFSETTLTESSTWFAGAGSSGGDFMKKERG
jgi:hypothetical protein